MTSRQRPKSSSICFYFGFWKIKKLTVTQWYLKKVTEKSAFFSDFENIFEQVVGHEEMMWTAKINLGK